MRNWYTKSQTVNMTPDQELPRQTSFVRGVYLTQSLSMARAYANGRTRDAHMGAGWVHDGVIFEVVLPETESHVGGDVWAAWKDDLIRDLEDFKETGQLGDTARKTFEAAGIESPSEEFIEKVIQNPDWVLDSIPHRDWSFLQEFEMGYSEIVLPELPWRMVHEVWVYDENGSLVKNVQGGFTNEKQYEWAKDDGLVYYHGSPRRFWKDKGF